MTEWKKPDEIDSVAETTEMLTEDGDTILKEDGTEILTTFWSGFRKVFNKITTIWK